MANSDHRYEKLREDREVAKLSCVVRRKKNLKEKGIGARAPRERHRRGRQARSRVPGRPAPTRAEGVFEKKNTESPAQGL